jgi:hypothetical protein
MHEPLNSNFIDPYAWVKDMNEEELIEFNMQEEAF